MASAKAIRTKINSVKSTQKITSAMQMVAASKMRKAQERMRQSKPYANKILDVIHHVAQAHSEYQHSYMENREVKNVGLIVVTTDRGLCGALNTNVLKEVLQHLKDWKKQNIDHELCLIGSKADAFFRHFGGNVVAKAARIGDQDTYVKDVVGAVRVMLDAYNEKRIDELYVCYSQFINTMVQKPFMLKLIPIESGEVQAKPHYWDYIYEPDSKELLDQLLGRYIESLVYQSIVDNNACEQAARMISMKNATDNASNLIDELKLMYNKSRQAAITQELNEIVSGAQAISK